MEPEKAKLKRQADALMKSYKRWLIGGLVAGMPFFASLISIILFTPLAVIFVVAAAIPIVFLVVFQKYFIDDNAKHLKQTNTLLSNTSALYTILILIMLAGSIIGFLIYANIVGSFMIRF